MFNSVMIAVVVALVAGSVALWLLAGRKPKKPVEKSVSKPVKKNNEYSNEEIVEEALEVEQPVVEPQPEIQAKQPEVEAVVEAPVNKKVLPGIEFASVPVQQNENSLILQSISNLAVAVESLKNEIHEIKQINKNNGHLNISEEDRQRRSRQMKEMNAKMNARRNTVNAEG